METNNQEKAKLAKTAFKCFFDQFGDDIYAKLLLEELFRELYNESENILISGTEGQKDHQDSEYL